MTHAVSGQFTLTTTASLVYKGDADGVNILLHNDESGGGTVMYLGFASGVLTTTGFHLSGSEQVPPIRLGPHEEIWGVVASGTADGSYMAFG